MFNQNLTLLDSKLIAITKVFVFEWSNFDPHLLILLSNESVQFKFKSYLLKGINIFLTSNIYIDRRLVIADGA